MKGLGQSLRTHQFTEALSIHQKLNGHQTLESNLMEEIFANQTWTAQSIQCQ